MNSSTFIFLDVGNTFLFLKEPPGKTYYRILQELGSELPNETIAIEGFAKIWKNMSQRKIGFEDRFSIHPEKSFGYWRDLFLEWIHSMNADPELIHHFPEIYKAFDSSKLWNIDPNLLESLEYWDKMGVPWGILSNWDERLPDLLSQFRNDWQNQIISFEVGWEKPSSQIFEAAESVTKPNQKILYLGDRLDLDYYPALSRGWIPFLRTDSIREEVPEARQVRNIHEFRIKTSLFIDEKAL
jgi:putative hydrolase of the HAD superfamily